MVLSWPLSSALCLILVVQKISASNVVRAEHSPDAGYPECTVTNPATKEFFDLRPLIRRESDKSLLFYGFVDFRSDWHINGHKYNYNFTLNICEPVLSDYSDVVGVTDRTNVSGFYIGPKGEKISIGYLFVSSKVKQ